MGVKVEHLKKFIELERHESSNQPACIRDLAPEQSKLFSTLVSKLNLLLIELDTPLPPHRILTSSPSHRLILLRQDHQLLDQSSVNRSCLVRSLEARPYLFEQPLLCLVVLRPLSRLYQHRGPCASGATDQRRRNSWMLLDDCLVGNRVQLLGVGEDDYIIHASG